jgi:hypothetical protein
MNNAPIKPKQFRESTISRKLIAPISFVLVSAVAAAVFFLSSHRTSADPRTWNSNGTSSNWSNPENWMPVGIPQPTDTVLFNATSTNPATIDIDVNVRDIQIDATFTGTITQQASITLINTFTQAGGTFLGGGQDIDVNGGFSMTGGTFQSTSGTLFVSGGFFQNADSTGFFNPNNGTVTFDGNFSGASNKDPFNNLNFNGVITTNLTALPMVVLGGLALNDGSINGGVLEVRGPVTVAPSFDGGDSRLLIANGAGSRTITFAAGVNLLNVTLNDPGATIQTTPSGTLPLNWRELTFQKGTIQQGGVDFTFSGAYNQSGASLIETRFICSNNLVTFNSDFTQSGGTFTGGSGNIDVNGVFTLSGGEFNSTSGTLFAASTFTNDAGGGTFNHHLGTVALDGTAQNASIRNSEPFFNLNFNRVDRNTFIFTNPLVVEGALGLNDGLILANPVQAQGSVTVGADFDGGDSPIKFAGSNAQTFTNAGGVNPTSTWTIDKASGTVTLTTDLDLGNGTSDFILTNGTITTGGFLINAGTRAITRTNGYIVGNLQRSYTTTGNKDFFVGTAIVGMVGGYSPVSANVTMLTQGPSSLTIRATQGAHPNLNPSVSLGRYWTVTENGNLTANLTFNYLDPTDMNGNEADYRVAKIDNNVTFFSEAQIPIIREGDPGNYFTVNNISEFANWTLGIPPDVSISPANVNVQVQGMQAFTAMGGIGPYSFSLPTNNSVGSIDATTGVYTAGTVSNVQDTVRVTDSEGRTSNAFASVTPGAPNRLSFIASPSVVNAGIAIAPSVRVAVKDQFGNDVTTASNAVTISLNNSPDYTLTGTLTRNAVDGISTFNDLIVDGNAGSVFLKAQSDQLLDTSTASITVVGAYRVEFQSFPSTVNAGLVIAPSITVAVKDQFGEIVTRANNAVAVSLIGSPNFTLAGTLARNPVNGIATFNDLTIDGNAGVVFLKAQSDPLIDSPTERIDVLGAYRVAFQSFPSTVNAGLVIAPSITVAVKNQLGDVVTTANHSVTISLIDSPDYTLAGTLTRNAVNGIATFNDLIIGGNAGVIFVRAQSNLLIDTQTEHIDVLGADRLEFQSYPAAVNAGVVIAPPITVVVKNQFGELVTTANNAVTISLENSPDHTLTGNLTKSAVNGIAIFNDLIVAGNVGVVFLEAQSDPLDNTSTGFIDVAGGPFTVVNIFDNGIGSLRQAMLNANSSPGIQTISFNIQGIPSPAFIIAPVTSLPTITDPVVIDGTTQPGFSGSPVIQLSGSHLLAGIGLNIVAGNCTVKGLIISRFISAGIELSINGGNTIQGNYIGTNTAGNAAEGNGNGMAILSASNFIGGTTAASRNVISGNLLNGIVVNNVLNMIRGNFIGTASSGTSTVPNGRHGIDISSSNSVIGGTLAGEGNVIAFNSRSGVGVDRLATGVSIRGNAIHSNGLLGISLSGGGATLNDPGNPADTDVGANNLQNYPVLLLAKTDGGNTTIQGTLSSAPSSSFTLDFYSNPSCDSSGFGEGRTYLGSTNVLTDSSSMVGFEVVLPVTTTVGHFIAATATDSQGNTSEFCACKVVVPNVVSISGHVGDNANASLQYPYPRVQLSGGQIASTIANSKGFYSFKNLPSGENYTVTVSQPNYDFSPPGPPPQPIGSRSYSNVVANVSDANFTGTKTRFSIDGSLLASINGKLAPLSGVAMTLSGTVARTATANASFILTDLPPGDYTLTPTKEGFAFTPANLTITNGDQRVNFTAIPEVSTLEGRITFDGVGSINSNGSAYQPALTSDFLLFPRFSNDGKTIRGSSRNVVSSINADGSSNGSNPISIQLFDYIYSLAWSPDETKVAFVADILGKPRIWFMNADGTGTPTEVPVSGLPSANFPTWLSNSRLIFSSYDGHDYEIYAVDANASGSNFMQLTNNSEGDFVPRASPDGTRIAFVRISAGASTLWTMNSLNGSGQMQISNNAVAFQLAWSPDGTRIAFIERTTSDKLVAVNSIDGLGRSVILSSNLYAGHIPRSWGPDYEFATPAGSGVAVNAGGSSVKFASVASAGTTTFTPITPSSAGPAPTGFVLSGRAYEISTTAAYTAPVTVNFKLPSTYAPTLAAFNAVSLLHNEGGVLVDRTTNRDFNTRTISATVTTLSSFVLAEQSSSGVPSGKIGASPKTNLPSITGLVQDNNGNPLSDILVQLTGTETRMTQTDAFGIFSFLNLTDAGNYNVQPKLPGYIFSEYSQDFISLTDENTIVFTGTQSNFSISGRAVDENGDGVSGVQLSIDGSTTSFATTDVDGNYTFTDLSADGAYFLAAFKDGFGLTPAQQIIDPLTSDQTEVNFVVGAPACAFGTSPSSQFFPMNGGSGNVNVVTGSSCSWTALASDDWITIVSADSGTGDGTVDFEVRENFTSSARQATISISGQLLTIVQDGGLGDDCNYSISSLFQSFSAAGGGGVINVSAEERCAWHAVSSVPWITITSAVAGIGNGTVSYTVAANPGPGGRAATITIGGKVFSVKQKGP